MISTDYYQAKRYAKKAVETLTASLGETSYETLQARFRASHFLRESAQMVELKSLLTVLEQDEMSLRLKGVIHQKLAVLLQRNSEDATALKSDLAAVEVFQTLAREMTPSNQEHLVVAMTYAKYPSSAARRGIEGCVLLEYTVDRTGRVQNPRVIEADPPGVFDTAAIETIPTYRYMPKIVNRVPVDVHGVRSGICFEIAD